MKYFSKFVGGPMDGYQEESQLDAQGRPVSRYFETVQATATSEAGANGLFAVYEYREAIKSEQNITRIYEYKFTTGPTTAIEYVRDNSRRA